METMKAALVRRYGPPEVVTIGDVPRPEPGPGEVLIRIHATTVSSGDHRIRGMDLPPGLGPIGRLMFGFSGPRQPILGTELSGEITAVGPGVTRWHKGQKVVAFPGARGGAHAEFIVMKETASIAPKPQGMADHEAAALCFGGTTALHFLRDKAGVGPDDRVLVTGAAGAVGSAGVQIARSLGAEVTAMCSPDKAETVAALGAAAVLPSGGEVPPGRQWDVILDCAGAVGMDRARAWLAQGGRLCQVLASMPQMLAGAFARLGQGRRVIGGTAAERPEAVAELVQLAEAGEFRPLIGATFPLAEIARAHELAGSRHKMGSAVVLMPQSES